MLLNIQQIWQLVGRNVERWMNDGRQMSGWRDGVQEEEREKVLRLFGVLGRRCGLNYESMLWGKRTA